MKNQSLTDGAEWDEGGLHFKEVVRQQYSNMVVSSGFVSGHPVDTLYLKLDRPDSPVLIVFRPDEMAAIAWVATGALWSVEMDKLDG